MNEAQIKLKRTESILLELIPEAMGSMGDDRFHELSVVGVECSRGRSDAKVFLDPSYFTQKEQQEMLKLLSKAKGYIESYCSRDQGWYKSPRLTFFFDDTLKKSLDIEELFKKIAKDRDGTK